MNVTEDRKDRQLREEGYLQRVSAVQKEYAEASDYWRIAENNRIITGFQTDNLLEKIIDKDNVNKKVKSNRGAGGIDGMSVDELLPYLKETKVQLVQQVKEGKYKPNPVRRVEIPKCPFYPPRLSNLTAPTVQSAPPYSFFQRLKE